MYDVLRGMPNLSSGTPYVCGACQKGKQIELLHMDLMGPMGVDKYSFVCVDDFSRFTWINFIKRKI